MESFYPEVIPWSYEVPSFSKGEYSPLSYFTSQLDEAAVPYLVSKKIFEDEEDSYSYPYFAETGTHWNELGSSILASKLFSKIQAP